MTVRFKPCSGRGRMQSGSTPLYFYTHTLTRPCIGGHVKVAADWLSTTLKLAVDGSSGCKANVSASSVGILGHPPKLIIKQSVFVCVIRRITQTLARKSHLSRMFGSSIGPFHNQWVSFLDKGGLT